jgi:hypothetical protein
MLMKRGFVKDLTPADRDRLDACVEAMAQEWFGPSSTVGISSVEEKEKPKKEKKTKTKAAVVSGTPAVMDRAHLETLTVSELKELGKECAAIKGRKPRAELIELVLQHLSGSSPVVADDAVSSPVVVLAGAAAEASEDGSDEELREEAPPVPAEEKSKKAKAPKEKKEKAVKEKKEKAKPKKDKKEKAEESPAESEDENSVELKEWFHPSEMSKPREERQRYFIDPKTNELFHPDRLQDGEPEWRWDEEASEILPLN